MSRVYLELWFAINIHAHRCRGHEEVLWPCLRQPKFSAHFKALVPKLMGATWALSRLLPDVRELGAVCRKIYEGVVGSMALSGAPIWVEDLAAKNMALLRRPQLTMVTESRRSYRKTSFDADTLLTGSLP